MLENNQLIRSGEATMVIADLTSVSIYTAYVAIRAWCTPVQSRGNLALYRVGVIEEVVARFLDGEWPSRGDMGEMSSK